MKVQGARNSAGQRVASLVEQLSSQKFFGFIHRTVGFTEIAYHI
nr:MAG TPA: hypothetical protein [Caudoviricetes sp.]